MEKYQFVSFVKKGATLLSQEHDIYGRVISFFYGENLGSNEVASPERATGILMEFPLVPGVYHYIRIENLAFSRIECMEVYNEVIGCNGSI